MEARLDVLEQSLTAAVRGIPESLGEPTHVCFSSGVGPVDFGMLRRSVACGEAKEE
eukprot:COSAG01_NODE_1247_length_11073_cov_23.273465_16_plen_56_part_00